MEDGILPQKLRLNTSNHDDLTAHYHNNGVKHLTLFCWGNQELLSILLQVAHHSQRHKVFTEFHVVLFHNFTCHFEVVGIQLVFLYLTPYALSQHFLKFISLTSISRLLII